MAIGDELKEGILKVGQDSLDRNDLLSGLEGIYGTDLTEQELAAGIRPTAEAAGTPTYALPEFDRYRVASRDFKALPSMYQLYLSGGFPERTTDPVQEFIGGETIDTGIGGEGEGETNIAAQLGTVDTTTTSDPFLVSGAAGNARLPTQVDTTMPDHLTSDMGMDSFVDTTPYSGVGLTSPKRSAQDIVTRTEPVNLIEQDIGSQHPVAINRGTTITGTTPPGGGDPDMFYDEPVNLIERDYTGRPVIAGRGDVTTTPDYTYDPMDPPMLGDTGASMDDMSGALDAPYGVHPITGEPYQTPRTIADQNRVLGQTFEENYQDPNFWDTVKSTYSTDGISGVAANFGQNIADAFNNLKEQGIDIGRMAGTTIMNAIAPGLGFAMGALPQDTAAQKFNRSFVVGGENMPTDPYGYYSTLRAGNLDQDPFGRNPVSAFGNYEQELADDANYMGTNKFKLDKKDFAQKYFNEKTVEYAAQEDIGAKTEAKTEAEADRREEGLEELGKTYTKIMKTRDAPAPSAPKETQQQAQTRTGGGSCFIAGTKVRMADGTDKNIEDIVVGDTVKGQKGDNKVIALDPTLLADRKLYSFNDKEHYFFTSEHPFMTEEGWKSIKPEKTKERDGVELYDQLKGELKIGDKLVTENGLVEITDIKSKEMNNPEMPLYNFNVSKDNSYIADKYIVHNKGGTGSPGAPGTGPHRAKGGLIRKPYGTGGIVDLL